MFVGSRELVDRARKYRKLLGGGMRQAGVLAAAGIVALREMVPRLGEDHENARYLAQKLSEFDCIDCDPAEVEINMVFCNINKPWEVLENLHLKMKEKGVLMTSPYPPGSKTNLFRFLTSYHVGKKEIDKAIECLHEILG